MGLRETGKVRSFTLGAPLTWEPDEETLGLFLGFRGLGFRVRV